MNWCMYMAVPYPLSPHGCSLRKWFVWGFFSRGEKHWLLYFRILGLTVGVSK